MTIFTNHKPLKQDFKKNGVCKNDTRGDYSPRVVSQRHLDVVVQFYLEVEHISGSKNVAADPFSAQNIDSKLKEQSQIF